MGCGGRHSRKRSEKEEVKDVVVVFFFITIIKHSNVSWFQIVIHLFCIYSECLKLIFFSFKRSKGRHCKDDINDHYKTLLRSTIPSCCTTIPH